ncbi:N-acetylneuraminate synthase family protein [Flavobacterium sp. K5-23]|uniref:N-acetylneuraminate synthase family protein n=1 Tax=Flavobacterium sp. K5-23 TaxID=2746225 RepID=UPI0020103798|nr:N-acetylneuraminate synthase family protein [Flavobacterium sp. K5-23]UQD56116.1 N-acetylneuraminate synthase family protein [Flavobacterium sp. K5-23]
MKKIKFGNKVIGQGEPLYFIADIGANHDGDINKAYKLIELAKEAGADAAKFQNFQASKIVSKLGFEKLGSQLSHQSSWKKSVYEVYEDASISLDWTPLLKAKCDEVGIDFFTSAYDFESVDAVDPFVDLYKIGSGDITWIEIIKHIAKKNKPVLIATGASEMTDVVRAMNAIEAITEDVVLMQCNTNYTVDKDKFRYVNLNVLKNFAQRFPGTILGLSDHTLGHATVLGAIALGAVIIEKHFTDSNDNEGPDHKFAMNPITWREMVDNANEVYYALGDGIKRIEENEKKSLIVQRRSLRAVSDFEIGHIITKKDLEALRPIPEDGFSPYQIGELVGKELVTPIVKGEHITKKHIQ